MKHKPKFSDYEIRTSEIGYSVYKDGVLIAAGGVLGRGKGGNHIEARRAIAAIIAGTRKPLSVP